MSGEVESASAPNFISSIRGEYERYKALCEGAIAQLSDMDLCKQSPNENNSIAILVWHLSGNFASRFTDFLTADGEKSWRKRDEEFLARTVTREELLKKWEQGWSVLFGALNALTDADLQRIIKIRSQPMRVHEALHRSLAHLSYHAGQIVYIARSICGEKWTSLSIPPGGSQAYNQNPALETAATHAERLQAGTSKPKGK